MLGDLKQKMQLAEKHLHQVQTAALDPVDWASLSMFGLYALEAAVDAASLHLGLDSRRTHHGRRGIADLLASDHDLPPVAQLLRDLNEMRKSEAYGDIADPPELDAEDVSGTIEHFVTSVAHIVDDR